MVRKQWVMSQWFSTLVEPGKMYQEGVLTKELSVLLNII